jgi:hypothetical protein
MFSLGQQISTQMAAINIKKGPKQHIPKSRVADGLALVVRDTHGQYDECFVERLLESSTSYLRGNTNAEERLWQLYTLNGHDDISTTRLLKFHKSLVEANSPSPSPPQRLTQMFLEVLPSIMVRNNSSEVSAALALLLALTYDDTAFKDLEIKRYSFNLRLRNHARESDDDLYQVSNILSIAKYYMMISKNYHIEESAKYLFLSLIMKLSDHPGPSVLIDELKQVLDELLMVVRTPMVYHVIFELFDIAPDNCLTTELFQFIKRLLRRAFDRSLEEQEGHSLVGLAKCLAKANIPFSEMLEKLKRANNLEAIIVYVTNINVFNNPSLFYFVIYPILLRCDSEDAQVLANKLFMTREEKYFVEKNLKDKLVQQCLTYLRLAAAREPPFGNLTNSVPIVKLNYSLDVVLEYLKCNYENSRAYKNLLECCSILMHGQNGFKKSIWLFQLIDAIFYLVDKTNLEAKPNLKPIFLGLLQLLAKSHHRSTVFRSPNKLARINKNWYHTVNLGFQYTDPEVLNEFANFFYMTTCDIMPEDYQYEKFVRLIWEHMLPISKTEEHHELLGVLAAILIRIDLDVPKSALDALGIRRHRDIPKLVSEILVSFSTVYTVVEKIIKCLVSVDAKDPAQSQDSDGRQWAKTKVGYLEWLDSEVLPRSVRISLDHLVKSICTVIKGECDEDIKGKAMNEINSLIKTLLINDDSPERLLKRLVRTGILEMLYVVSTCSLYSNYLQQIASEELPRIRKHVLEKLGSKEQVAAKILSILAEEKNDGFELQEKAKKMTDFLASKNECKRMKRDFERELNPDRLGLLSYLNDILDYQRIDWGPSECY